MSKLNIWVIIGAITILQGLLLSVAVFLKSSKKNAANMLLGVFILLISLSNIGRIAFFFPRFRGSLLMGGLMDVLIFSYGPLSYFYLKNLFNGKYTLGLKDFKHFIPVSLFLVYFFYQLLFPKSFQESVLYKNIGYVNGFLELFAIVVNVTYVYIGYRLLKRYEKRVLKQLSFQPQIMLIKSFLVIIFIIVTLWSYGFISKLNIGLEFSTVFSYDIVWILISLLTFVFAYFSFFDSGILSIQEQQSKYEQGYFSNDYYDSLRNELDTVMKFEKPFLNSRLTLSELGKSMQKNQRDLSRVINEQHHMNFYEFINSHRIEEFKELVQKEENKNYTILSLAFASGFNSKSTFNSVFKKHTKSTPKEYIKQVKKAHS